MLSVFTRDGVGGNLLGVVTDVSGLSDALMQQVATELGFSETIYIDWRDGGMPRVRIFTPSRELPFAGHPLVGAGWVLSELSPGGPRAMVCEVAEVPYRSHGDRAWIEAPKEQPVEPCQADLSGIAGVVSAFTVLMPGRYLIIQLENAGLVQEAPVLAAPDPVYLWAWTGDHAVKARFFAPGFEIVEDPATGSAAVALSRVLTHTGMSVGSIHILQGDEIGRPSLIEMEWSPERVTIGGTVARIEMRELDV